MKKGIGLKRGVAFVLALFLSLSGVMSECTVISAQENESQTDGYWTDTGNYTAALQVLDVTKGESTFGTSDNPYLITCAEDLALLAVKCASDAEAQSFTKNKCFRIVPQDGSDTINLSAHEWVPIMRFYGTLDGNGTSVQGLKIGSSEAVCQSYDRAGLFGRIDSGAIVKELSIDVAIYTYYASGTHAVGGVAGMSNGATVDSCKVTGIINAGSSISPRIGGVLGIAQSSNVINTVNQASVKAEGTKVMTFAGGIAGYSKNAVIVNCCNLGNISSEVITQDQGAYAGGIAVLNDGTNTLLNCYNAGIVSAVSGTNKGFSGSIAGQALNATMDYLYWKENTAGAIFGKTAGTNNIGNHVVDKALSEEDVKAMADTLNSNVDAIKVEYSSVSSMELKKWNTVEGTYPMPTVEDSKEEGNEGGADDGGKEDTENGTIYWTTPGKYTEVLHGEDGNTAAAGTETNPYLIKSAADLAWLAVHGDDASDTQGKYFKIIPSDASSVIDMSAYEWNPPAHFYGYLDGNGVCITGLKVESKDTANVGLFGRVETGAKVEHFSVEVSISTDYDGTSGNHIVGGVAGINMGLINDCTVIGNIYVKAGNATAMAGGVAGRCQLSGMLINCVNHADVTVSGGTAYTYAAGITGNLRSAISDGEGKTASLINCANLGRIQVVNGGSNYIFAGGIAADVFRDGSGSHDPQMHNVYNAGKVSCEASTANLCIGSVAGRVLNTNATGLYWQEGTAQQAVGNMNSGNVMTEEEIKSAEFLKSLNLNASKWNESSDIYSAYKWVSQNAGYPVPGNTPALDKTLVVTVNSMRMGTVKIEVQAPGSTFFVEEASADALVESGSMVRLTPKPVSGIKFVSMTVDGNEVTLTDGSYTFLMQSSTEVKVTFEVSEVIRLDAIYVNPDTEVSGDGTSPAKAFKTLGEAQEKLREVLVQNPTAELTVYLMGGTYVLDEVWELNEKDVSLGRVTFKNYESETPVITSAHRIPEGSFQKVSGKEYYAYQIPESEKSVLGSWPAFRDLLVNGKRATLARTEEYTYVKSFKDEVSSGSIVSECGNGLYISEQALAGITNENLNGVELGQLIEWKSQTFHIGSIKGLDASGEVEIEIKQDEWERFHTTDTNKRVLTGRNYWLQNHIAFLDEPGEFYYDETEGIIYYYPYADEDMQSIQIEYAVLDNLISMVDTANITFEGITFTGTTANFITENGLATEQGLSYQTYLYDPGMNVPCAAIIGDTIEGISIQNCNFEELGGSAMVFNYNVSSLLLDGNSIRNVALGGIMVGVNQREFSDGASTDVTITNNYITNIGLESSGAIAIKVARAKELNIQHNTIIHVPYTGIMVGWGWNLKDTELQNTNLVHADISYNYIEDYLYKINDGGAIYTCSANAFADNTAYFNEIHHNYIRAGAHNGTYTGIYHDGSSSNWHTYENVIDDLKSKKGPMFFQDDVSSQYTHNILAENNYTTISAITTSAKADRNILLKNNLVYTDRSTFGTEALAVLNNAGVQSSYKEDITPMDVTVQILDNTMHYVVDSSKNADTQIRVAVTNHTEEEKCYTLSLEDALPEYVSYKISGDGKVTLAAGECVTAIITCSVTDKEKFADSDDYVIGLSVTDSAGRRVSYPRMFTVCCSTGEPRIAYGTPDIDGVMDAAYAQSTSIPIGTIFSMLSYDAGGKLTKHELTEAVSDLKGYGRLLWDEEYLYCYIYVEETDGGVASRGMDYVSTTSNPWANDGVELYINTSYTNGKATKFAVDAFGVQRYGDSTTDNALHDTLPYATAFTYQSEIVDTKITAPAAGQYASTSEKPVDGYVIEMALPLTKCSDLKVEGVPQAGDKIYFYMQNNDYEDVDGNSYIVSYKTIMKEYVLVKNEIQPDTGHENDAVESEQPKTQITAQNANMTGTGDNSCLWFWATGCLCMTYILCYKRKNLWK